MSTQTYTHICTHTYTYTYIHSSRVSRNFHPVYQTAAINFKNKNWGKKLNKNMFKSFLKGSSFWKDMHKTVIKIFNMYKYALSVTLKQYILNYSLMGM